MKNFVNIITFIAIINSTCFSQKKFDHTGTYMSIKPDSLSTFIIKQNTDNSLFGTLKSSKNNGYVSLLTKDKTLSGTIFSQDGSTKDIEIFHTNDTLSIFIREDSLRLEFVFVKIKLKMNAILRGSLDSKLYGKWISIDDKTKKILSNQYHIFHPNGDLELVHPKLNGILASEAFRSGDIKVKWATEDNQWYIIYDSNLPLLLKNMHMGSFRFNGDTLYTVTPRGNISKSLRDKKF